MNWCKPPNNNFQDCWEIIYTSNSPARNNKFIHNKKNVFHFGQQNEITFPTSLMSSQPDILNKNIFIYI